MLSEIVDKLREHLSNPVDTEASVVYLMVEVRKAIDRQKATNQDSAPDYRLLRLYSNWVVHVSLEELTAGPRELLRAFDESVELRGLSMNALYFLSFTNLRAQMSQFLVREKLPTRLVDSQDEWERFLDLYVSVVSECPITYRPDDERGINFKYIRSVSITRGFPDDEEVMKGMLMEPFKTFICWRVELRDGDIKHWPFYA